MITDPWTERLSPLAGADLDAPLSFPPLGPDVRVLMVWPRFPPSFYSLEGALPFVREKSYMQPLALTTVAALLPPRWRVRLVDRAFQPLHDQDILDADLVMVSAMHAQRADTRQVLARCRALGRRTLVGGPWAQIELEALLAVADHIVVGEVDECFSEIAADFEAGRARRLYRVADRPDVTRSPVPRFEILDMKQYLTMTIQFSRGCPFQCEFCDIPPAYGRRPRTKTPEQFVAELDTLYRLGWRGRVTIADDNFIGNHRAALALTRELQRWQRDHGNVFEFSTEASIDLAQRLDLLDAMVAANFQGVFLGIETPSVASLRETKKYQNLRGDILEQVRLIQGRGLWVVAGFIIGFDSDDESIFQIQEEFIRRAAIPCAAINLLQAIPTTPLYARLKAEGRLDDSDPDLMVPSSRPNFHTVMPADTLLRGTARLVRSLYAPDHFFERGLRSLERWMPTRNQPPQTAPVSYVLRWIARSLWMQGLRSRYRRAYWRFVTAAIARWWRDPSRLEQAGVILMWAHHLFQYYGTVASNLEAEARALAGAPTAGARRREIAAPPAIERA